MFGGPNPHTEATLPLTIGHKKSGKISEIGEDVSSFRIDGKIVIELLWTIATTVSRPVVYVFLGAQTSALD